MCLLGWTITGRNCKIEVQVTYSLHEKLLAEVSPSVTEPNFTLKYSQNLYKHPITLGL